MKCLKCNNTHFVKQNVRFSPTVKEEAIEVIVPCHVCKKCGTPLMDTEQMNTLRRTSTDKYRELHGLLTSLQIIRYREELGMSQSSFARYLNVGEASIKRWETYFVQDASQDEHIRLKCDEACAEINFLNVYWKRHEPDIYSGNRKFSFEIFKNVALFFAQTTKESIIYLNKLHFYADFYHFLKHGTSLTGARYVPLKYGPCPDQYRTIYAGLVNKGYLKENKDHTFEVLCKVDLGLFDDNERETLQFIQKLSQSAGAKKLYSLSHKEQGYTETAECDFISYAFAKKLLIEKKQRQ
jgi:putative zinc finger/helix-turn-helix YgiT family protein